MKTVIVSTLVTDEITLPSGQYAGAFPGGAGLYALCGAALFEEDSLLLTGVGEDCGPLLGGWFTQSGLSQEGLLRRDAHTAVSRVQYQAGGERVETPAFGLSHYQKLEARCEDLENQCREAQAVYIFKDFGEGNYWERVLRLRETAGFSLLWELNADITTKEHCPQIKEIAQRLDILSLNRSEAFRMLDSQNLADCARRLQAWGLPAVYLRCGKQGALYITGQEILEIPALTYRQVVDVTGGGNSSSAAVLCGYARGLPPAVCGRMGSVAAALCIAQYGPPAIGPESRAAAQAMLQNTGQAFFAE